MSVAPPKSPPPPTKPTPARTEAPKPRREDQQSKAFWIALALPGIIWLILLFIVPFYAVLGIAEGQLNRLTEAPIAQYNPLHWSSSNVINVYHDLIGATAFAAPIALRTLAYVVVASLLCLVLGYRAAQGHFPGAADRPVLDQLHDAHARLDRPAAGERLRQQGSVDPAHHLSLVAHQLARRQAADGHPGPGLRI